MNWLNHRDYHFEMVFIICSIARILAEAGIITSNYCRQSICQMFLFLETYFLKISSNYVKFSLKFYL